jgi:hypothetical protein
VVRVRKRSPVARSSRAARSAKFAGIGAAVLASQPFSVDQVGAAERPVAQQRLRARLDAQCPIGATCACRIRESLERFGSALVFPAASGRLDQLDQTQVEKSSSCGYSLARSAAASASGLRGRGAG